MYEIVKFKSDTGVDVQITPQDVKQVLCPQANDKEIAMFLELCRAQRLNPFIKDAYLIKYGTAPASIVTGKEVFTKRANANKNYKGFEAGVVFVANGKVQHREGSAVYKAAGEVLVGGWCRVFVEGRKPFYDEVSLDEYSTGKSGWAKMPATMIRKVALVHCLREAFPDDFQGLYAAEEMGNAGDVVLTGQAEPKQPAQPATAPQAAVIEATVLPSVEQIDRIEVLCYELAGLRGIPKNDVYAALMNSGAMKAAGVASGGMQTEQQAAAAVQLLEKWREQAKAAQIEEGFEETEAAEVEEMALDVETGELYETEQAL